MARRDSAAAADELVAGWADACGDVQVALARLSRSLGGLGDDRLSRWVAEAQRPMDEMSAWLAQVRRHLNANR
ncbi:hypothetical protein [Actinocatenispora sera]|uniref:Uncharacterized protein n=1 Tax=Actinocatenispora sera TaxID=390989 RepID=A0A810L3T8_9ACTN|nr:hypothetical protein [Actinocatenispora sera]BCJ29596.1 hypothetical protein Asera_37040 [Actinocatenispora sera]BCJ29616.1 hypothetical protein Asera_37240 [Actinocatenispora sera]BCJ29639.1 hypothetical protein Asera_37470 [Actinocatenispora sera]BCJ29658.1 hypothetical protein Asera_37660 [Actinocatenispora sera]BCJ29679.1 hypothetical protein Asera_37870 [Actinocatenispora sera]